MLHIKCINCGKMAYKRAGTRFCSRKCRGKWIQCKQHNDIRLSIRATRNDRCELRKEKRLKRVKHRQKKPFERTELEAKNALRCNKWNKRNKEYKEKEYPIKHLANLCGKYGFSDKTTNAMILDGELLDKRMKELKKDVID